MFHGVDGTEVVNVGVMEWQRSWAKSKEKWSKEWRESRGCVAGGCAVSN